MKLIKIKKKNLNKDLILKNKLFSVFLLNTGHSVVTNKQINLYKTVPVGLALTRYHTQSCICRKSESLCRDAKDHCSLL